MCYCKQNVYISTSAFTAHPPGAAWQALMVEGREKKHAYIGFVYIPAKECDLTSIQLKLKVVMGVCNYVIFLANIFYIGQ